MKKFWFLGTVIIILALVLAACTPTVDSGAEYDGHVDTDENNVCDACSRPMRIALDLFSVNDLHGKFADSDSQPGVDELTTYLLRQDAEKTVILSTGDMWQGKSESNLTKGAIVTEWMNAIGCVSMTMGNHEYDWGSEAIYANADLADFPFLACNVYDVESNSLVDYCQPSVMVERSGLSIGIIGAIGDCYSSISADLVTDIYFKTGSALTALVKAEAQKLRAQGADLIVYSLHDGYESSRGGTGNITDNNLAPYYDIALSDYVDVVFEGHTHQHYSLKDSRGIYHVQGGGDNEGIAHATVVYNHQEVILQKGGVTVRGDYVSTSRYTNSTDHAIVSQLLDKYAEQIAPAMELLGNNTAYRNSSEMRQDIAMLYLQAGLARWGEEYSIVLGGGYLSARDPYDLETGSVYYGTLMDIFPFDNRLALCSILGSDLKSNFLSGDRFNYYVWLSDYGKGISTAIVDSETYYIVVDTYSSSYAPNRLTVVEYYDENVYARDLLADYIRSGGYSK